MEAEDSGTKELEQVRGASTLTYHGKALRLEKRCKNEPVQKVSATLSNDLSSAWTSEITSHSQV